MKKNIKFKGRLRNYLLSPMLLTILLILMNVPIYIYQLRAGLMVSAFVVIYFVVVFTIYHKNKALFVNELINFATQYGTVQKKLLNEFDLAYALIDYTGKILWVNEKFTELTGKNKDYHKSITSIFSHITKEIIQKNKLETQLHITYGEHDFRAQLKRIEFSSVTPENDLISIEGDEQYMTALYLYDETQLNRYIRENDDQKMVAALVYIDNYEETMNSIEDVKQSLLTALIDRKVNKYFSVMDGIVRKIEKDKYFVIFRNYYLSKMEEDKFSLIEEVKTVKVGNKMAVTLSIGVGNTGATYNQNYEYARMAIGLALGRGGDQVVVKEGEQITYFGGRSKQVDKNTRVKARVKAHALREILESRSQVIVMGHHIADVDSFGAAIGVYCAGRILEKKVQIVLNEVTTSLRPLKECFTVENGYAPDLFIDSETAIELTNVNTLVMVVDTNRPNYTDCPEILKKTKNIVVFDHHRQGSEVVENPILSYIEPYASSTCEMIAEVLQYFAENITLSACEADAIYAGILIDTNNFMQKTGVRTFEAAAYLRRCGAEVTRVRKMLRNDMADYKARAEVMRDAEVYRGAFAISACPADKVESPTVVCAQSANELLNIIGIKASFVLTDYQNKIFISSRSIDEINVQLIMERLGGGGHANIAGAQLTDCNLEVAKQRIRDILDGMIEKGEIEK
ncbi:MAG: DHH family phosphoesterase [Eubacterium sp.]|nr:DHH family phosphoesterase [Eubacterium sp.]MCI8919560.1 DHH family phosphoesterase [Eubacterium sp.]